MRCLHKRGGYELFMPIAQSPPMKNSNPPLFPKLSYKSVSRFSSPQPQPGQLQEETHGRPCFSPSQQQHQNASPNSCLTPFVPRKESWVPNADLWSPCSKQTSSHEELHLRASRQSCSFWIWIFFNFFFGSFWISQLRFIFK